MQVTHENGDTYTLLPWNDPLGFDFSYNVHTERDRKRGMYAPTFVLPMIGVPGSAPRADDGIAWPTGVQRFGNS